MNKFLLVFLTQAALMVAADGSASRLELKDGWAIQSSAEVHQTGDILSTPQFQPKSWYNASVPATVVSALVADKVYADPYVGMNLRSISGTTYPIGANFSNIPMPPESPFRSSWWYRTKFQVPDTYTGKQVQLHFDGLNFRANVWLNGMRIADSRQVAGSWRLFRLDVTKQILAGQANSLAVEVFPPTPDDLAITFVDWNPSPPDKGMGIWRAVYLTSSGPVAIGFPNVLTKLNVPDLKAAHLTPSVELTNWTDQVQTGSVHGEIGAIVFTKEVTIQPKSTETVAFTPQEFPQLNIRDPRVWWPAELGPQNLYDFHVRVDVAGTASDEAAIRFGIRDVTSEVQTIGGPHPESHRLFKINGRNILIRGAGYSFDMLLRESRERDVQELQYVRDMNLNTVRLEGKLVNDDFLQLADEYGILITAGWCCCDHWEHWKDWDDEDVLVAKESLRDQIRRLRSHPSLFNWMNGSDNPPPPPIESMYISVLKEENWPNPFESSATARPTSVTGATGVKMTGPYDYVPPDYWLLDNSLGGAHGFNTETSPGPAVPPLESLREMLPSDKLWPVNSFWDYHAGGGVFRNIGNFDTALDRRYGQPGSVEDYALTSQLMAYEGERAMFEAYGRNKYVATGVIQWMLNNAWPSMIWHLYDYYLRPGGGYFGTKKACERLHVQYSYDDRSVVVVNSFYRDVPKLTVAAQVYNADLSLKYSDKVSVDVASDGVKRAFVIPEIKDLSSTYFLRLTMSDSNGNQISDNFYWLSTKADGLDWKRSTWYYTPETSFADFQQLRQLPKVNLGVTSSSQSDNGDEVTTVTVRNPSKDLAFFVHLKVEKTIRSRDEDLDDARAEVLPVLWDDNYISLLPGEERRIKARYSKTETVGRLTVVSVDGWNIVPQVLTAGSN